VPLSRLLHHQDSISLDCAHYLHCSEFIKKLQDVEKQNDATVVKLRQAMSVGGECEVKLQVPCLSPSPLPLLPLPLSFCAFTHNS
jgi:hypothetical protein